jgi:hypothetical protein
MQLNEMQLDEHSNIPAGPFFILNPINLSLSSL